MVGKFIALLTFCISLIFAASSDSICPSSAFLEKRTKAFEDVKNSIKKAVVLVGDDAGNKTDRELYEGVADKLNRSVTESDYIQYTVSVGEIAIAAIKYCETFDISRIAISDVITLIKAFRSKLADQKLYKAKKLYGSLLCINSRQSSKRSTPTELHTFFNSLNGEVLDELLFSLGSDKEGNAVEYSLAFVVDDTGSMRDEINAVKRLIFGFIRTENKEPLVYILSTFNDPVEDNMGPFIFSAKDEDDLVRLNETVSELYAHDGGDCPEYGMTAIFETLTEVLPYSNIIVLTDAAAKDDHYKSRIIHTANRKNNSIHFFLSSSSCVTANTSLQHYRDIANETDGIVVDSITDFGLLTTFSKTLREKLSVGHVADKRKRSSIISVIFHASVFTESINILFTKFITDITITTPEGNIIPVSTSGSLASYNKDKPPPGKYIVSSSREFEYRILLPSNCDVLVEHYGNKSIKLVKGEYIRVLVSTTKFDRIKTTSPIVLQLLSTNGALLSERTLNVCSGVFAGYITIPGVPYQYKIEGFDNKGHPFSSQKSVLYNPVSAPVPPTSVPKAITCPCENGGTCVRFTRFDRIFTSCKCATGYRGRLCQEVHFCSTLAPPPHGKITCYLGDDGKPNPGDSCDVQCNDGYDQIGGLSRTCTVDGIWNGRETVCIKRVACPLLDAPSNGTIDCILGGGGEPNPGEYCTFACDDGYELLGSVTRTCRDDGNWSGNSNVCTKKGPPSPVRDITTASSGCLSTTVSWDPVTSDPVCGPVSYDVIISPSDGVVMMRITDTSYNFTGLTPDNSYTVTVAGRNSAGVGESTARMVSVAGIQTVNNLMATDNCLNVNASWTTITGPCSNSVQYMITLSSSSDTIGPVVTSDTSYNFNNTVMLTGDISVSVVAFIGNTMGTSIQVATQPSLTNRPQITTPIVVERCVSYLYITWNDTTQCVPVNYTVMLSNTSSSELLHSDTTSNNFHNYTGLTSDTLYSITITGRNRVGQDVVMNHTSSLKSEVPPMVIGVTPSSITTTIQQVEDITISWMAPLILNPCTTSLISNYEVQIDYTNNDGHSTDSSSVPGNISSILMSDYFPGHPLSNTTYNISVIAVNEGGRGIANTPTCDCGSSDDNDLSTGAVVAITLVVTFIITLFVIAVMTYVITRKYYKHQREKIGRRNNNKNNDTQDNSQFVLMGRDVKMDTNPSYAIMDKDTIKMDTNPSYAIMDKDTIKMDTNPAYAVTK